MLEFLTTSQITESITIGTIFQIVSLSFVYGVIISLVYMMLHKKEGYDTSFPTTLVMLAMIISIIILLVGNNAARAFSLAGAFSIIRFRNVLGDPLDMSYVFFVLAIGLACGTGYVGYAGIFTLLICAVLILLKFVKFGIARSMNMNLKILIPENLNYVGVFDDILNEYTKGYTLKKVKTSDFGSTFELLYKINIKQDLNQKEFIDELRKKNGNLNIVLTLTEFE